MVYVEIVLLILAIITLISDIIVVYKTNKRLEQCNECYKKKYDVTNKKKVLNKFLEEKEND